MNFNKNQTANIKITRPNSSNVKSLFYAAIDSILGIPNIVFYTLLFISLVIVEYYNFYLNPDMAIQLHTLRNFVNGNGITITSLDANNNIVYLPCSLWPAGLVIFLSPVYLVIKSAVTSALIMKVIGNTFFILFLSKYFEFLKLENYKRKCFKRLFGKSTINYRTGLDTLTEVLFIATVFAPYKFFSLLSFIIFIISLGWGLSFILAGKGFTSATVAGILVAVLLWCLGVIAQLISGIRKDLVENAN